MIGLFDPPKGLKTSAQEVWTRTRYCLVLNWIFSLPHEVCFFTGHDIYREPPPRNKINHYPQQYVMLLVQIFTDMMMGRNPGRNYSYINSTYQSLNTIQKDCYPELFLAHSHCPDGLPLVIYLITLCTPHANITTLIFTYNIRSSCKTIPVQYPVSCANFLQLLVSFPTSIPISLLYPNL